MKAWQKDHEITDVSTLCPPYGEIPGWRKEGRLVVPPNLSLKRKIMYHVHDAPRKHPNRANTLRQTSWYYWWPDMENWIGKYVENCEQCHGALPTIKTASDTPISLRTKILKTQQQKRDTLESWGATQSDAEDQDLWVKDEKVAIPPDETLRRESYKRYMMRLLLDTLDKMKRSPKYRVNTGGPECARDHQLRRGVRNMPTEQKHHSSKAHPTVPYPHHRRHTSLRTSRTRPRYWLSEGLPTFRRPLCGPLRRAASQGEIRQAA